MKSRPAARPRLCLEALEDRSLLSATPAAVLAWTPNDPMLKSQYGLNNTGETSGKPDADIDAPEAWGTVTSSPIVVADLDTGIDYVHPDLYQNVWINQAEIPSAIKSKLKDVNGDGKITFVD